MTIELRFLIVLNLSFDDEKTPNDLLEEGKNIILNAAKGHIPKRTKKNYQ